MNPCAGEDPQRHEPVHSAHGKEKMIVELVHVCVFRLAREIGCGCDFCQGGDNMNVDAQTFFWCWNSSLTKTLGITNFERIDGI